MEPGTRLGTYEIEKPLGAGGMGEVYQALDLRLKRPVAIKVLPAETSGDVGLLQRLQREARTLAALDHPNIVGVHSIEEEDGVHFVTMTFVDGVTLGEMIPEGGLPADRVIELATPLADALRAAHERGIVHRDLKPGNIMVDTEGRVRVLDFGIAKQLWRGPDRAETASATETMTAQGSVIGTFPYMSPEQAEGRSIDARSDIFSLGIVLFEMATGRRPFQGRTPTALISSILREEVLPLNHVNSAIPASLARIVARCLEKDPEQRYSGAAELRDDLIRAAAPGAALTGRGWGAAAAAVLVAASAIGWLAWQGREARDVVGVAVPVASRIQSLAVLPLKNGSGDPEQDYFATGMTEALITDLSKIGALTIISPSAARRYAGTEKPLAEIADELGVDAVIEGQVLRDGGRVAITVQLIDPGTGQNHWAERYERELTSVLALQGEVARAIAAQIEVQVTPAEAELLSIERAVDSDAYEAYLKGRANWNSLTPEGLATALQYYELALQHDPEYAPALSGIAMVWGARVQMGIASPQVGAMESAAAATRALALDDTLPEARFTLGSMAGWGQWNWPASRRQFERALAVRPNDPYALSYYAHVLLLLGEPDEALARAERALELDPFDPLYRTMYGAVHFLSGRFDAAESAFREVLRVAPGHPVALQLLWPCLVQLGRYDEALEVAVSRLRVTGGQALVSALEEGDAAGGYAEALRRGAEVLRQRSPDEFLPAVLAVPLLADSGDFQGALDWVDRALQIHDPTLPYLTLGPLPDEVRLDPRFRAAARTMGLEHNLPPPSPE